MQNWTHTRSLFRSVMFLVDNCYLKWTLHDNFCINLLFEQKIISKSTPSGMNVPFVQIFPDVACHYPVAKVFKKNVKVDSGFLVWFVLMCLDCTYYQRRCQVFTINVELLVNINKINWLDVAFAINWYTDILCPSCGCCNCSLNDTALPFHVLFYYNPSVGVFLINVYMYVDFYWFKL